MKVEFSINANGVVTIINQDQETYIDVTKTTLPFTIEVTAEVPLIEDMFNEPIEEEIV